MRVTIAICTWNRCDLLRQTLERMTGLMQPPGTEWELLVVNNNCTDGTDQVLSGFEGRLPLRRVFESRPGQSNARNAAVGAARGEFILWTDDDVLVDPNWLNPRKLDIAIDVQNGRALSVTDLVSDRPLELLEEGKKFKATIPEGLFRILEVRLE